MLWSKQYYNIDMPRWLDGDPGQLPPPEGRKKTGRNNHWRTLNNEDIISMPDKWEYPEAPAPAKSIPTIGNLKS